MHEVSEQSVTLRPLHESDLDALFRQMSDPESVRMAAFTPEDPNDRQRFVKDVQRVLIEVTSGRIKSPRSPATWTSVLGVRCAFAPGLEVGIMTQPPRISSSDCNVLRGAFVKCVIEKNIPQDRWRDEAALLIRDYTDSDDVDSNLLEWIIRTGTI